MRHLVLPFALALLAPSALHAGPPPAEIPPEVYAQRRASLMKALDGCAAAIKSHPTHDDIGQPLPDPWFFYLTGVTEEGAALVFSPQSPARKVSLFFKPLNPEAEIWTGYRAELTPALRARYQVDVLGRSSGHGVRGIGAALRRSRCWATLRPAWSSAQPLPGDQLGKLMRAYEARTLQRWEQLEAMRATHDAHELARMDQAIAATVAGHRAAAQAMRPGMSERQLQAVIESAFYNAGATGLAFPSIVATGANAAVLHYMDNDAPLAKGDMVLLDIGASYGGYAADISRTWPLSGRFTKAQRAIYDKVLAVQDEVIKAVRPGISLEALDAIAKKRLEAMGFPLPHGIGHFVGLEVHDVGDFGGPLAPGMVITVEPGIYLRDKLGVRIEDMVLVTEKGHKLMTDALPRRAKDIEAFMAAQRSKPRGR